MLNKLEGLTIITFAYTCGLAGNFCICIIAVDKSLLDFNRFKRRNLCSRGRLIFLAVGCVPQVTRKFNINCAAGRR